MVSLSSVRLRSSAAEGASSRFREPPVGRRNSVCHERGMRAPHVAAPCEPGDRHDPTQATGRRHRRDPRLGPVRAGRARRAEARARGGRRPGGDRLGQGAAGATACGTRRWATPSTSTSRSTRRIRRPTTPSCCPAVPSTPTRCAPCRPRRSSCAPCSGPGKPIGVICHGPWLLVSAELVKGRTLTSWPSVQDDIRNAGGSWVDREVVVDGNWVSTASRPTCRRSNRELVAMVAKTATQRLEVPLDGLSHGRIIGAASTRAPDRSGRPSAGAARPSR
jgi:hypothetical protein